MAMLAILHYTFNKLALNQATWYLSY